MSEPYSEMARAVKSTDTVRNIKKYAPTFYARTKLREQEGKKLVWTMVGVPPELLVAFDMVGEWPENYGTLCAAQLIATGFCEEAEAEGYANDMCSYVRNTMGYLRRCREVGGVPPEAPLGGMGNVHLLLGSGWVCEPRYKWFQAIATHYMDVPVFNDDPVSPAWDTDLEDPRIAEHYKTQLRATLKAQVTFLEDIAGRGLDLDHFRIIMQRSHQAMKFWHETLELRKAVPCPMGSEDYYTAIIPQLYLLGTQEAVDFYQALYNEIKARVDGGQGVIAHEKYRFSWFGIPPWFNLGLFNWLESLGAIVCVESSYYVKKPPELDFTDPVEALVDWIWQEAVERQKESTEVLPEVVNPGRFSALVGSKLVARWIEEYKLDGAICHRLRSCRASSLGEVHFRNVLAQIGIPTLIFESDMTDPRAWSDAQIKAQFREFLEMIDASRAKRGGRG
ncbi:MAG TPA: 2-hydroxyacyl-CoA dehydratase [Dehalococcoidia bacterium]|jgi:benzoyl-CoA reductase/2-hydroxyglutaryl-CoA dehydratase subunit BcrC/BadD/HgdB|nr:2-hydroxyacyl-CoA dehydratase [Dehalococcoidia bacterium]